MKRILILALIPLFLTFTLCFAHLAIHPVAAEPAAPSNGGVAILLQEGFDAGAIPSGWTVENSNGDSETWIHTTFDAQAGSGAVSVEWNSVDITEPMDDWLFTPAVTLTAGIQYQLSFYFRAANSTWTESLEVKYGTAPSATLMTTELLNLPTITDTTWTEASVTFVPTDSNSIYIGLHGYSVPDQFRLYVDTVQLEEVARCHATADDGVTVHSSADAHAVKSAIDEAGSGGTVKTAGICASVSSVTDTLSVFTQTIFIDQDITLLGGYDLNDWSTADDPNTVIDPFGMGRGVYVSQSRTVTISNHTIQNGAATGLGGSIDGDAGGGIYADVDTTVTLTNTQLQDNNALVGGGVYHNGTLDLHFSNVFSNSADMGGGIYAVGVLLVSHSAIAVNSAGSGGGIFIADGAATIGRSILNNNQATDRGGAIYVGALQSLTVADGEPLGATQFLSNSTGSTGGAIFHEGSSLQVGNIVAEGNSAINGGVIYAEGLTARGSANVTISGGKYVSNTAQFGAGIAISNTAATISGTQMIGNNLSASGAGGGIHNGLGDIIATNIVISNTNAVSVAVGGGISNLPGSHFKLVDSMISNHALSSFGVGINNGGWMTITGSTISGNHNSGTEGGAMLNFGSAMITGSSFENNMGPDGGAITNRGTLSITTSLFKANTSMSGGGGAIANTVDGTSSGVMFLTNSWVDTNSTATGVPGGGILNTATATIERTTISSNTIEFSDDGGAGIRNTGVLTINNSTVSGNAAASSPGGGISNEGTLTLLNSTIAENSADGEGSGLYTGLTISNSRGISAVATIRNTVFANANNSDCVNNSGTVTSFHSIYRASVNNCAINFDNGNQTDVDPLLSSLADNGGTAVGVTDVIPPTHALAHGSKAIAAGEVASCPAIDQRGITRIGVCDIGAYEAASGCYATNDGGVTTESGGGVSPILGAILSASSGDTIHTAGVCVGVIDFGDGLQQAVRIDKNLTLNGANAIDISSGVLMWDFNNDVVNNPTIIDAIDSGRGIVITNSVSATIYGVHITNGNASGFGGWLGGDDAGGGLYATAGTTLTLQSSQVYSNIATVGGGIYSAGDLTVLGTQIYSNSVTNAGGGIFVDGPLLVEDSALHNNAASNVGGGINSDVGTVDIVGGEIYDNTAVNFGGGINLNGGGKSSLDGVMLRNNVATNGGGLSVSSNAIVVVDGGWMEGNSAELPPGRGGGDQHGGAVHNAGTITMTISTLISNTAQSGGGVYNDGLLTIVNNTFSSNSADVGGGIENSTLGVLNLYNSTFYSNSTALHSTNGTLDVANTILAGSTMNDCVLIAQGGQTVSFRNNIIEDSGSDACDLSNGTDGNQVGVDPLLIIAPLSPAQPYYALSAPSSPAIDAGSNDECPLTDQRILGRTDGACDIGSYEVNAVPTATTLRSVVAAMVVPIALLPFLLLLVATVALRASGRRLG